MATYDLQINGQNYRVEAEREIPLLWILRDLAVAAGRDPLDLLGKFRTMTSAPWA